MREVLGVRRGGGGLGLSEKRCERPGCEIAAGQRCGLKRARDSTCLDALHLNTYLADTVTKPDPSPKREIERRRENDRERLGDPGLDTL